MQYTAIYTLRDDGDGDLLMVITPEADELLPDGLLAKFHHDVGYFIRMSDECDFPDVWDNCVIG